MVNIQTVPATSAAAIQIRPLPRLPRLRFSSDGVKKKVVEFTLSLMVSYLAFAVVMTWTVDSVVASGLALVCMLGCGGTGVIDEVEYKVPFLKALAFYAIYIWAQLVIFASSEPVVALVAAALALLACLVSRRLPVVPDRA